MDELVFTTISYPLKPESSADTIRLALAAIPALRAEGKTFWNWIGPKERTGKQPQTVSQAFVTSVGPRRGLGHAGVAASFCFIGLRRWEWSRSSRRLAAAPPHGRPRPLRRDAAAARVAGCGRAGRQQAALYAALIALIATGIVAAAPRPFMPAVQLFGIWPLPKIAGITLEMMRSMPRIHATLTWALLALIGLHVAAAIYGTLIAGERTILRMLPWPRRRTRR